MTYPGNDIPGWMTPTELQWLYETAKTMDSIVEIGTWKGRSTHALCSGCKGKVTTIDSWKDCHNERGLNVYTKAQENLIEFKNLTIIKQYSLDAVKDFPDKSVDMVFIDGSHDPRDVEADIAAWLPKVRRLICGHDYSSQWLGVISAVNHAFGPPDGTVNTIWYHYIA